MAAAAAAAAAAAQFQHQLAMRAMMPPPGMLSPMALAMMGAAGMDGLPNPALAGGMLGQPPMVPPPQPGPMQGHFGGLTSPQLPAGPGPRTTPAAAAAAASLSEDSRRYSRHAALLASPQPMRQVYVQAVNQCLWLFLFLVWVLGNFDACLFWFGLWFACASCCTLGLALYCLLYSQACYGLVQSWMERVLGVNLAVSTSSCVCACCAHCCCCWLHRSHTLHTRQSQKHPSVPCSLFELSYSHSLMWLCLSVCCCFVLVNAHLVLPLLLVLPLGCYSSPYSCH